MGVGLESQGLFTTKEKAGLPRAGICWSLTIGEGREMGGPVPGVGSRLAEPGWPFIELPPGHWPMFSQPRELADLWRIPLAAPFSQPELALPIIVEYARQHPVLAVLATDDTGSLLAAQVAAALGLQHNSPQAALAARNKHLMRQLFAAAGVPSPQSTRYDLDTDLAALAAQLRYPVVLKPVSYTHLTLPTSDLV